MPPRNVADFACPAGCRDHNNSAASDSLLKSILGSIRKPTSSLSLEITPPPPFFVSSFGPWVEEKLITRYRIGQANFHGRSFPLSIPGERKKVSGEEGREGGREGGKNDQGAITNFFLPPLCFPPSGPVAFDLKVLITGIVSSRILQMGVGAGLDCHNRQCLQRDH